MNNGRVASRVGGSEWCRGVGKWDRDKGLGFGGRRLSWLCWVLAGGGLAQGETASQKAAAEKMRNKEENAQPAQRLGERLKKIATGTRYIARKEIQIK